MLINTSGGHINGNIGRKSVVGLRRGEILGGSQQEGSLYPRRNSTDFQIDQTHPENTSLVLLYHWLMISAKQFLGLTCS